MRFFTVADAQKGYHLLAIAQRHCHALSLYSENAVLPTFQRISGVTIINVFRWGYRQPVTTMVI